MAESFQNEIPGARINITLDVESEGARRKVELPLKLLAMGDFSNGKAGGRLAERERIAVDRSNIEQVMKELRPEVRYRVDNVIRDDGSEIDVRLSFEDFRSFDPEHIVRQVPELYRLLAMRNLLKDLKSNLLDNGRFRRELERIVRSHPELEDLRAELEELVPAEAEQDDLQATEQD